MSIKVSGSTREIIPAGNYVARCYSMIHVGTVPNTFGNETKLINKVLITWELPTLVYEYEEQEYSSTIFKEYTLSLSSKANLRRDLESWRGKAFTEEEAEDFDLTKLLGVPCMLNVIHKTSGTGKVNAIVSTISRIPEGLDCPAPMREKIEFNFEEKFDEAVIEEMPDFIKNKIKMSQEYMAKLGNVVDPQQVDTAPVEGADSQGGGADDLPF